MSSVRAAYRLLAVAGFSLATLSVALSAHALLGWSQSTGLLGGDYNSHQHGSLIFVATGMLATGAGAAIFYALHLLTRGKRSLPSLARACLLKLSWAAAVSIALAACATLFSMEMSEQFFAHHFDGVLSAFGATPVVAIAVIGVLAIGAVSALRGVCKRLVRAHERIVMMLVVVLDCVGAAGRSRFLIRSFVPVTARGGRGTARVHGERAPPVILAL